MGGGRERLPLDVGGLVRLGDHVAEEVSCEVGGAVGGRPFAASSASRSASAPSGGLRAPLLREQPLVPT